jgi:hypothetical protein
MNVTIHATYCTLGTNAERTPQRPRRPATLVIATDDGMMPQRHAAFARLRSLGDERPPIAAMAKALGVPRHGASCKRPGIRQRRTGDSFAVTLRNGTAPRVANPIHPTPRSVRMLDLPIFRVTPTEPVTGTVERIDTFEGNYGPSYRVTIVTDTGRGVILERQERLDKLCPELRIPDVHAMVGRQWKFWKRAMEGEPTKGYLNINEVRGNGPIAPTAAATAPAPATPTPPPAPTLPPGITRMDLERGIMTRIEQDIEWAFAQAQTLICPDGKITDAMQAPVVSLTATLFIRLEHERQTHGIQKVDLTTVLAKALIGEPDVHDALPF